jgi:hypothetical protein
MIGLWDKKKQLQTLMMKRRSGGGAIEMGPTEMNVEHSSSSENEPDPRHAAAQDIMMSMDSKSPEKLMQSLANFMDLHKAHYTNNTEDDPREE